MTSTANLGLPLIDGGQAQKHVTHNEALRILDAAIQIAVQDLNRTAPPASPAEGQRHVVAAAATGAWAGQDRAIATYQDGAWSFLVPAAGWCAWSLADAVVKVFDGTAWRDAGALLNNVPRLGVNTTASAPNLLSMKSNAALLAAITTAEGGSGDLRLQLSKESAAKTASVVFSDNYSGRAEFGLVGADSFRLKVSPDGSAWVDGFSIDQTTGNLSLPRGLALTGVIAPATITANQNDYTPAGIGTAAVLQLATDAARNLSGLAGGAEGRVVSIVNVGSQPLTLLDDNAASSAANRLVLGGNLTLGTRQAAMLRYDATASRWQLIAAASGLRAANNLSDLASAATALGNLNGVSYGAAQALSSAQQLQALGNLGIGGGFTAYTPTVTALVNSFPSASATGRYLRIGKLVTLQATITITTAGSGLYPILSLPSGMTSAGFKFCGTGQRNTDATLWQVEIPASGSNILMRRYDNNGTCANGDVFLLTITFEIA
jgi:hypothetical protein